MTEHSLAALQAWMQDRVTAGTWQVDACDVDARAVVSSSDALSAEERLSIYARSYVLRLAECLRTEFPVLRSLIGDQVFNLFVGGYLSARPPVSYSLYDLGAGFAEYLEATRPRPHSGPGTPEALPASLARLERALAEADRAPGIERDVENGLTFDALALLHDPGARLCVPPPLRLLRLDFDFTDTLASARDGNRPQLPDPGDTCVAVARSHYQVRAHTLEPWAFVWLEALKESGGDVHATSETAVRASGADPAAILARLLVWLPSAIGFGLVASL
jgi:hypothetical protein